MNAWLLRRGVTNLAAAFNFYIGPSGSDSNDGLTPATPWAITALNTKRATYAGKTVGFLDGTYNVRSILLAAGTDGYVPAFDLEGGPNPSTPTVLKAVNARLAIIDSSNGGSLTASPNPTFGHTNSVTNGPVKIDGLKFQNWPVKCLDWGDYGSASNGQSGQTTDNLNGTRYIGLEVTNCEFTGGDAHVIGGYDASAGFNISTWQFYGPSGAWIHNNYVHDVSGYSAGSGDHISCLIQWWGDDSIIEYNTIINAGAFHGKEVGNQGNKIRYNYMYNPLTTNPEACIYDWTCIQTAGVRKNEFYNNVLIGAQGVDYCHTLFGAQSAVPAEVHDNTIYIISFGANVGARFWSVTGCKNFNNLIAGTNPNDPGSFSVNTTALGLSDYNLLPTTSGSLSTSWFTVDGSSVMTRHNLSGLTAWQTEQSADNGGLVVDAHSVFSTSPAFVTGGAPSSSTRATDFQLQGGSPAKNAGKSTGLSGGVTCDIGAWGGANPPSRIGSTFG